MKEIIITSSVLILCIMLIRVIFKGKISSRLQYALWLLVALRLMIPASAQIDMALGSIEEFRIMDLANLLESKVGDVTEQLEQPVNYSFTMSLNSDLAERAAEFMLEEELDLPTADGPTSVFYAGKIGLTWLDVLRGIWMGGMLIVASWMIMTNVIFMHKLHRGRKEFVLPESERSRTMGKTRVYMVEGLASPCLYGIPFREAVYLTPDIAENKDRLRHVLTHEMCHKRHGDSLWSILRSILLIIYWVNPLVWMAAVLSRRDCELACDEEALLMLGEEERISYGETLLSIITRKGKLSDIACTATTMTGSGKSVKERIKYIAEKPRVLGITVVAVLTLVIVVSVLVFTKNPLLHGTTWEGETTITAGDMQIKLPETIAGISGYETDSDGDIIIYHVASGKEVGRFREVSFGEAVTLVEEGREVVPLGYYGNNSFLREYLNRFYNFNYDMLVESVQHEYTPNIAHEDPILDVPGTDSTILGVPGTDSNDNDTTYIIDDYNYEEPYVLELEKELKALEEDIEAKEAELKSAAAAFESAKEHEFTEEEKILAEELKLKETELARVQEELERLMEEYKESTADLSEEMAEENNVTISYEPNEVINETMVSEQSADYLPNEEIIIYDIPSSICYIYVQGDYSGVKDQYLEEMEYINSELKAITDQVIVLSINREIREEIFEALAANRTRYLGEAYKVVALVSALRQPNGLQYTDITTHTLETDPETALSLEVNYQLYADNATDVDEGMMYFNAVMLFATVENMGKCSFVISTADDSDHAVVTYYREDLEDIFGQLWSEEAAEAKEDYAVWIESLYNRFIEYRNNGSAIAFQLPDRLFLSPE